MFSWITCSGSGSASVNAIRSWRSSSTRRWISRSVLALALSVSDEMKRSGAGIVCMACVARCIISAW
jgi:hypothetical protein